MPWRAIMPERMNPWWVMVSEVMLQQTTIAVVKNRFVPFINQFPTPQAMVLAGLNAVMDAWAGLGYYRRAHNLYLAAQQICDQFGGHIPQNLDHLLSLRGLGDYTARAVALFGFHQPFLPVDANIYRLLGRVFALDHPTITANHHAIAGNMQPVIMQHHNILPDMVQAMMDLARNICTTTAPACGQCPLANICRGRHNPGAYPPKIVKKIRPIRYGWVAICRNLAGDYIIRRRPENIMLGGMNEFVSNNWHLNEHTDFDAFCTQNAIINPQLTNQQITHHFTHFTINLQVILGQISRPLYPNETAIKPKNIRNIPFPSLMKKLFDTQLFF